MHLKATGLGVSWCIYNENDYIFEDVMADKATKRSISLKSGKTMNFLENHCYFITSAA